MELRRQVPGINDRIDNAFQRSWRQKVTLIANVPEEFHHERDADEEIYINLAIVSNANASPYDSSISSQFIIGLDSH